MAVVLLPACSDEGIAWTDPLTLSAAASDGQLRVDQKGRVRLVNDTTTGVVPAVDSSACGGSMRAARLDDGTLAATWWSVRPDSSAVLYASTSPDGGSSWSPRIGIDTADVSTIGCSRPAPAIAASAGFVHIAYSMRAPEGVGVFYAHSMNDGKHYEPPVTIVYGDRLTAAAVAADKGSVAVAYEDPSGSRPQIGLAISRDWGHIFRDRTRGSTGVGAAVAPQVAIAGREIAVSWLVGAPGGSGGTETTRPTRVVRVGQLQ
jgi:hypothetical protein